MLRFTVIIFFISFLLSCNSNSDFQETEQKIVDSVAIQLNDSAMKRYQDYVFGKDESISNLEVAIEELNQAIEIEPEVANFYSNRSQLLLLLGKNDEAIEALKKILTFKPDFAEGIESIGYIYEITDNYSEAQKWYQKAIEAYEQRIKEDRYLINSKLAIVHLLFFTENAESALQAYNELKQEYPESEEIQFAEPFFKEFDREKFLRDFQGK